jgi:hypothetical protein
MYHRQYRLIIINIEIIVIKKLLWENVNAEENLTGVPKKQTTAENQRSDKTLGCVSSITDALPTRFYNIAFIQYLM